VFYFIRNHGITFESRNFTFGVRIRLANS